jgi:Asp-tRNA(Asn)/Glu-tRNA(Gln) amidotransferase A subunit family amidase
MSLEPSDIRVVFPAAGRFTGMFSVTGHPTITFPAGLSRAGLPIGVQLAGAAFREATLLRLVHHIQSITDWHLRRSPLVTQQ